VIQPGGQVQVEKLTSTELTAESYFLRGRYDREISQRVFWFVGSGWEQNEFAGIDRRISAVVGAGYEWYERDQNSFSTDMGLTYTEEQDIAGVQRTFAGAGFSWSMAQRWTQTTTFESQLKADQSFEDAADLRADLVNSVAVAMNSRISIKLSLQLLFDNQPAFELVEVLDQTGQASGDLVAVELDDLDSIYNAALVVNF
jgi:putative salt-induced outer membrane protein YdiY